MDLRHLRYFIAVAEERHFTRAAERIGIKQPPLSLAIQQLERELGTPLLHRLTRGLELTDAGTILLESALKIIDQVERAKADVQSRARGDTGHIHVGFAGATYFHSAVPALILSYRELYPNVQLSPAQSNTPQLIEALHNETVDVAFVRPPLGNDEGIAMRILAEEPMLIVLPLKHPRAGARSLPLATLAQENWILFPRSIGPGLHDSIIASCQRAGFTPTLGQEAPQLASIAYLVAAGFGVSIVPRSLAQIHAVGIVYIEIEGEAPQAPIGLAYRRDNRAATVQNFVTLARQQASRAG